jgi:hypothetical protein
MSFFTKNVNYSFVPLMRIIMKTTLLCILSIIISVTVQAQSKKVALHHAGTTTLFQGNSAYVQAVNAAVSGDTIYIPGGYWDPASIDKRLTIYGAGHYPDSTTATGKTYLMGGFGFLPGSDSSIIQGVDVGGDIMFYSGLISYVTINRCAFNSSTMNAPTDHITFSENVIRGYLNMNAQADFLNVRNNFITTYLFNISQGALIENNIFNHSWGGVWYLPYNLYNVYGSLIRNNIFMEPLPDGITNGTNNLFEHNLFTMTPNLGINTSSSNYTNIAAANLFTLYTGLSAFYYTDDYHLQSPASYLGTDGTQVGLYGGLHPYKTASVPANPHIRSQTVAPNTDASGNLNINITVGAQDR